MNDDLTTKSTLETLLEMMRDMRRELSALRENVNERFDAVESRLDAVDARFDTLNGRISELDIRIDRTDSWAHKAYSVMTDLSADFNEMKAQPGEHIPGLKP